MQIEPLQWVPQMVWFSAGQMMSQAMMWQMHDMLLVENNNNIQRSLYVTYNGILRKTLCGWKTKIAFPYQCQNWHLIICIMRKNETETQSSEW